MRADVNPWGCGRVSSEARRKHREGAAGRRVRRGPCAGKSSVGQKPHERQRHETRPQGRAKRKPSRVCKRPRREGCPGGTGQWSFALQPIRWSSNAEGAENLKGGASHRHRQLAVEKREEAAPNGVSVEGPKPVRGRTAFSRMRRGARAGRPRGRAARQRRGGVRGTE